MYKGISVIVCCYNSALKLPLTLKYLASQVTDELLEWEILIVNNNSTDDTVDTAKQAWQSLNCKRKLHIINEYKAGLSYAREAGAKAAIYDIIIFCDDDNLLSENYLQYGYRLVRNTIKSGYGIWGGKLVAYFDDGTTIPDWFEKEKSNYVIGTQGFETGDITRRGYVWGAGMIMLKQIYLKIINQKFPLLLNDRTGGVLTSGGDSEICLRSMILGYKLYYDEALILKHYISKNKLTPAYNKKLIKGFISADYILKKYRIFIFYIAGKKYASRLLNSIVYLFKYHLSKFNLRKLTAHDSTVLNAFFNKKFNDFDFAVMHQLLKSKKKREG